MLGVLVVKLFLFIMLVCAIFAQPSFALDRCNTYVQEVRRAYYERWGIKFPYHYAVGQLQQESNCRPDITAFDGGMGIAQYMPATKREIEKEIGIFNAYNPIEAIKANAYYMKKIHRQNWDGGLWITYMFYNSGSGTVKKEYIRAGVTDYSSMKAECKRKVIVLKNGGKLDMCTVGYDYPQRVYTYGRKYKIVSDGMRYW